MNVYLHIGLYKTATTTIQYGLFHVREALLKDGWLCPIAGSPFPNSAAVHNIPWMLLGDARYHQKYGDIHHVLDEIDASACDHVILSSEVFSTLEKENIFSLYECLRKYSVKIVVYLRSQDQMIQSIWSQVVKGSGQLLPFEEWAEINLKKDRLDYYKLLKKWSDVFSKENIIVRPFETAQLHGHVLHDFLGTCGVEKSTEYELLESRNISPGIKTLEVIRNLAIGLREIVGRETFFEIAKLTLRYGVKNGWDDKKLNVVGKELYQKIMREYEAGNKTVAKTFLGKTELFLDKFQEKPLTVYSIGELGGEEVLALAASILKSRQFNKNSVNQRSSNKKIRQD